MNTFKSREDLHSELTLSLHKLSGTIGLSFLMSVMLYDSFKNDPSKQHLVIALGVFTCLVLIVMHLKRRRSIKAAIAELDVKLEVEQQILVDKVRKFDDTKVKQLELECDVKWFIKALMFFLGLSLTGLGLLNFASGMMWPMWIGGIITVISVSPLLSALIVRNKARLCLMENGMQFAGWPLVPWSEITDISMERIYARDDAAILTFKTTAWARFVKTLGWLDQMKAGPKGDRNELIVSVKKIDMEPEMILKIASGLRSRYQQTNLEVEFTGGKMPEIQNKSRSKKEGMILSIIIGFIFIYYGVSEDGELARLKKVGVAAEVLSISDIKNVRNHADAMGKKRAGIAALVEYLIMPETYSGLVVFNTQDNKLISEKIIFHGETLSKINNHEKLTVYHQVFHPEIFYLNINEINWLLVLIGVFFIIIYAIKTKDQTNS